MEKFKKWLDNYWYHNKWPTLIVLFFVVAFAIGFGQIAAEKNSYDLYVMYGGAENINAEEHALLKADFTAAAEGVSDGDSEGKDVNIQPLIYLTEEDIAAQKAEVEAAGQTYTFNYVENRNVLNTFMKLIVSGENVIMILSPHLYSAAEANEVLYPIKDILGREVPGMTDSGLGVKLSESGLLEKYPSFGAFPEDSIICLRKVTHAMQLIGESESEEAHQFQLSVARELFEGIKK